jgi:hypothetical protein
MGASAEPVFQGGAVLLPIKRAYLLEIQDEVFGAHSVFVEPADISKMDLG